MYYFDPIKPENAPDTIYLNFGSETCWCADMIEDDDVEYTKGSPEQIAKRLIGEWLDDIDFHIDGVDYLTDVRDAIYDWLDRRE